jgi:hypothetical protein
MVLGKVATAFLGTILLVGSALAQETPPAAPPSEAAPPAASAPGAPPSNTGRLYIVYPQQPHADYPSHLAIDDAWFADTLAAGNCIYFDLPPGSHVLHTVAIPKLSFSFAAGATKYVELRVHHSYVQGSPQDDILPRSADTIENLAACTAATPP